jgi:hypothetical protein
MLEKTVRSSSRIINAAQKEIIIKKESAKSVMTRFVLRLESRTSLNVFKSMVTFLAKINSRFNDVNLILFYEQPFASWQ